MTERRPARGPNAASTESLHFRMPAALRSRLRRFAEERNLGESEALRLAISERLNEIDDERDLAAAERWQYKQAWATWERIRSGAEELLTPAEIHRRLEHVLEPGRRMRGRRKSA